MTSLLTEIRTKYNLFSSTQKVIANYILDHPDTVSLLSITELAKKCHTSETTVMRLLKKLNYSSYQIFRINLAKEFSETPSESIIEEILSDDNINTIKKKVIGHTITAINDLEHSLKDEAIETALNILLAAKRVLFFGVGASASISMDAMHKFGKIGLNVCSYPDPHFMNIIASHASADDVLFAVSHTGESLEVLNTVAIAQKNKAKIIALSSFENSTLAQQADIFLSSSTNDKKYHSEAMASRIVQLTIIDILYLSAFMRNESVFFAALSDSRDAVGLNKT
ncbi:MurR/RpiR family transcriptional regulator [Acetobacterium woodii]|uniref:Transcriptional regulator RpiR family n=1 Tax=Acetobacterium woodii (strain ATCC 29683 / DSM 1030 / JCM 2381 / KCTC 1655 / WB1) TaxID=931626 RepID=H6LF10_ACEWD|nr:MurR/RpiR family transcriptional regulator [Acetobacterium woodii]AFA46916.1 transcriptional regulator RpiR family [Acetobacterium woodii DSM 1030]